MSGPNGGSASAFYEVNGIIYDNYAFADPLSLRASPTADPPFNGTAIDRAQVMLDMNFYRIFYPKPDDVNVNSVAKNPWLATTASVCAAAP